MRAPDLTDPLPGLAPGDRVPDFILPGRDGKFYSFYERVRGRRSLLLLASGAAAPVSAALAALADRDAELEAAGVDVFVVLPGAAERLPEVSGNAVRTLFADVKGKILEGFRGLLGDPGKRSLCLLLDPNQRLLERIEAGDPQELAASAVFAAAAQPPAPVALTLGDSAPVLLLPGVLEPALCRHLIGCWRSGGHAEGTVEAVVDGKAEQRVYSGRKRRLDHTVHDETLARALLTRVHRRLAPELQKACQFEGFRLDRFVIGCYQAERGDYFRAHRDNLAPTTRDRMFALSINLNSDDYEGGDVWFPEYGPHRYRPPTGGALVFSCSLIHEALPVTRGERFVLLSFLRDARQPRTAPA